MFTFSTPVKAKIKNKCDKKCQRKMIKAVQIITKSSNQKVLKKLLLIEYVVFYVPLRSSHNLRFCCPNN